jgi:hypothetical protein
VAAEVVDIFLHLEVDLAVQAAEEMVLLELAQDQQEQTDSAAEAAEWVLIALLQTDKAVQVS